MATKKHISLKTLIPILLIFGTVTVLGTIWYWALINNNAGEVVTAGFFTCVACVVGAIIINENT